MSDRSGAKKTFSEVLEEGAKVDPIFDSNTAEASDFKLQEWEKKYQILDQLFSLITKEYSFNELSAEILKIAIEHIPSQAGAVFEVDYKNDCMFFRAAQGQASENLLSLLIPKGEGVVGFVCENQQSLSVSNTNGNPMYLRVISDFIGFETHNVLAHPIVIRGVTFGCIELLNREAEHLRLERERVERATRTLGVGEKVSGANVDATKPDVNATKSNANSYLEDDQTLLAMICQYAAKLIENRLMIAASLAASSPTAEVEAKTEQSLEPKGSQSKELKAA